MQAETEMTDQSAFIATLGHKTVRNTVSGPQSATTLPKDKQEYHVLLEWSKI